MSTEFETEGARAADPNAALKDGTVPVQRNRALFALYLLAAAAAVISGLFFITSGFFEAEFDEIGNLIDETDAASKALFQGLGSSFLTIAVIFLALGLVAHAINWQIQTSSRK